MAEVYIGYDKYGVEGVNDAFIRLIFDVVVDMVKLNEDAEVGVVVTDDSQMQALNKQYRGKDYPTNVLSFGYQETVKEDFFSKEDQQYLGDIYLSNTRIVSEADEMKISPRSRFAQLFVHGLLHLAGMHHDTEKEALQMEDLEDQILAKLLED